MSLEFMEVSQLRWSHDSIFDHFSDGTSVYELFVQLILGERNVTDIAPMEVVPIGGHVYSLSNSRLYAFLKYKCALERVSGQTSPLCVPVKRVSPLNGNAFTTASQGTSVELSFSQP